MQPTNLPSLDNSLKSSGENAAGSIREAAAKPHTSLISERALGSHQSCPKSTGIQQRQLSSDNAERGKEPGRRLCHGHMSERWRLHMQVLLDRMLSFERPGMRGVL